MPELPDLTVYMDHLDRRVTGETLFDVRLASPFVLRTVAPTIEEVRGRTVTGVRRLAKQIVFELEGGFFIVIHLMIAGRLRWRGAARAAPKGGRHRNALAEFDFSSGTMLFTEASRKKRASLRLVKGEDELAACDPGGLEVFATDLAGFVSRLRESRHTFHPSSRMTMPATINTIPTSSSAVDRSRKKKYEAMKVKTSSICPTART